MRGHPDDPRLTARPAFGPGIRYAAGPTARLRNRVLNAALHQVVFAGQQRQAQACLADCAPGARLSGFFMDGVARADAFLQLSVPSLDYPRPDLPPNINYIGPVLPATPGRVDLPDWWAEPDRTRPVVLVTQGTIDTWTSTGSSVHTIGPVRGERPHRRGHGSAAGRQTWTATTNVRAASLLPFDLCPTCPPW